MQISELLKHEKQVCLNQGNMVSVEEKSAITCCSDEIIENQH